MEELIPYNGTVFNLCGVAQLDHSVDTNVTAVGIWSGSDILQVTKSPPYMTCLEIQPLTSDSSKEYTLNITIRPTDGSSFIVASSTSIVYRLIVQRKFVKSVGFTLSLLIVFFYCSTSTQCSHHHCDITWSLQWLWGSQSSQLLC